MGNGNGTTTTVKVLSWAGGFTIFILTIVGIVYQTVYAPLRDATANECEARIGCDKEIVAKLEVMSDKTLDELKSLSMNVNDMRTEQRLMKQDVEYIKRKVQL